MSIIVFLPVLVCVLGALTYALAAGKASELGRLAFWCGLLVTLFEFAGQHVKLP